MVDTAARLAGRTLVVDMRVCQMYPERGTARYLQDLVRQLSHDAPSLTLRLLYTSRYTEPLRHAELSRIADICFEPDLREPIDAYLLGTFALPAEGRAVAQALVPTCIARWNPALLGIVHDLIPGLFPDIYLPDVSSQQDFAARVDVMGSFDHLFAVSDATRRDAISRFMIEETRITTVSGAIDKTFWTSPPADDLPPIDRAAISAGRYLLYVCGDDWRKNVGGLLRAYARARTMSPSTPLPALLLVCRLTPARRLLLDALVAQLQLRPEIDVLIRGPVSDLELRALVSGAQASIYPSHYEGLGLPILESYAMGRPVFGSGTSSMADLIAPECTFDPRCMESMAAALIRIRDEPVLHDVSLCFGRALLDTMTWQTVAERILHTTTTTLDARRSDPAGPSVTVRE